MNITKTVKVRVVEDRSRKNLILRWTDPVTERVQQRSTKTENRAEALKMAGELEAELRTGRYAPPSNMTWQEFRRRHDEERGVGRAIATLENDHAAFNSFEDITSPRLINSIDSATISRYTATLKNTKLSLASIAKHLRHLKAAFRWAAELGLMNKVPHFDFPKAKKGNSAGKGRAINDAEFEQLLAAVPKAVRESDVDPWRFFLKGLMYSGLRMMEAAFLMWDRDDGLRVRLNESPPVMFIPSEHQKNRQDSTIVLAPEFADLLRTVPENERTGRVFKLPTFERNRCQDWKDVISKLGSRIGRESGIVTKVSPKTGVRSYVTLHDLRRSFGTRWAKRVEAHVLQAIMRHESLETTMKYYVGRENTMLAELMQRGMEKERSCLQSRNA